MINRVIFEGKVYYKVADLAKLFDVSVWKMRKIIKAQDIGAPLRKGSGFGRAVFVLEENVAKINITGEVKVLETKFTADPVKKTKVVELPTHAKKKRTTAPKKTKKKKVENVVALPDSNLNSLQKEFEELLEKGRELGRKLYMANQMSVANAISDEHFGIGGDFLKSTIDDIEKLRLVVPKLEIAVAELNESSGEIAAAIDETTNDSVEPELNY
ncbi:hypothetical protein LC048_14840 [Mesobacillus subterraneus]|uniref:hypothetical protein n=1 Tax=Mesobacillus subterraneus TaxID=285983 RepID=UPI001CFF0D01|nr:hypothetical protein [Mesobacillus subterraneus]WLR53789.1 hypothetical protein LC048_14840 [Mesobacillus subterraneus]